MRDFCDKIAYAFQLATGQGPLCQEPIQGTAVFLEELAANDEAGELDLGRLTGEAIKLVRESITQGFLDWSPRVMLAMYSCEIQASSASSPLPSPPCLYPYLWTVCLCLCPCIWAGCGLDYIELY